MSFVTSRAAGRRAIWRQRNRNANSPNRMGSAEEHENAFPICCDHPDGPNAAHCRWRHSGDAQSDRKAVSPAPAAGRSKVTMQTCNETLQTNIENVDRTG